MGIPIYSRCVAVTALHAYVADINPYFTYQKDMSTRLAGDVLFRNAITTEDNIAVYDLLYGVECPRYVFMDKPNNKLLIYWNAPVTSVIDRIFYICVGPLISRSNSTSTYTLSEYNHYWPYNNFTDTTTSPDVAGGHTCTRSPTAHFALGGLFGNGAGCQSQQELTSAEKTSFNGASVYTFEACCWLLHPVVAERQYIAHYGNSSNYLAWQRYLAGANSRFEFGLIKAGSATGAYVLVSSSVITAEVWFHYAWVFDGTLVGDTNRLKCYINGVQQTVYYYSNPLPSSLPTFPSGFLWTHGVISGETTKYFGHDEHGLSAEAKSSGYLLTRANMLIQPNLFWYESPINTRVLDLFPSF